MRRFVRGIAAFFAAAAVAVGLGYLFLRGSLPQINGSIALSGLQQPVKIVRDEHGVPTIRAQSEGDAFFALGFVHAQDRLWQMDVMRRTGQGRLSEVVGTQGLRIDRFMRTLGIYRLAQAEIANLDRKTLDVLESYAAGVNAYIQSHPGAWPLEYYLLRTAPEPWTTVDSLVWGRLMALRLSTNYRDELVRARLLKYLTPDQIQDLWPGYPAGPSSSALDPEAKTALAAVPWDALSESLPPRPQQASASNNWVVSGEHSASGKPVLANDPHLSLDAPDIWYLARIETPDLVLAGATVAGVPFLVLGHNGNVAWGFSSSEVDAQDLFIERVVDRNPGRYVTSDGTGAFTTRREVIKVRGGGDVEMTVRETRHGPVISDVVTGADEVPVPPTGEYVIALADAGLRPDDHTADALYLINRAKNADDVARALAKFETPPQNVIFADRDGAIGLYSVGRVPLRKGPVPFFPVPGWTDDYDWDGVIPFAELPRSRNPKPGVLVAANNRLVGDNYPYPLAASWPPPWRAKRVFELLDDLMPLSPAESAAMQLDTVSLAARSLLPRLLAVRAQNSQAEAAYDLLSRWDGDMRRDRPEPLIYSAWLLELGNQIVGRKLGDVTDAPRISEPLVIQHLITEKPAWCDDPATVTIETCDDAVAASLNRALSRLSSALGDDMTQWKWGDMHKARFRNSILGTVPLLEHFADQEIPTPGDDSTINRGTYAGAGLDNPFIHRHGPVLRAVYDMADLDSALFMIAPGQSGNLLSPQYHEFTQAWRDGQYLLLPATHNPGGDAEVLQRTLTLVPEGP